MPFELLFHNQLPKAMHEKTRKEKKLMSIVYENKTSTAGIIYEASDLERYLKKHDCDPVEKEQNEIKSIQDIFERNMKDIYIFEIPIQADSHQIIKTKYRKFEIYSK